MRSHLPGTLTSLTVIKHLNYDEINFQELCVFTSGCNTIFAPAKLASVFHDGFGTPDTTTIHHLAGQVLLEV